MKKLLAKIRKILRDRRTRRFLTRFVSGAAALIVFVTTYALVLPAITMEKEANCGIEAHQHDDSCYTEELICDIPESDGHHHDESCYSTTSALVCETEEHEHSAENGCYDDEGNLICEVMEHRHNEECYKEVRELTCQIPESEGHHHTEDCYEKVLTCGKEVHVHSTACYENDPVSESAIAASNSSAAAATTSAGSVSSAGMTLNFEGDIDKVVDFDETVETDKTDDIGFVDNSGSDETNGSSETNGTSEIASSVETSTEAASDTEVTYGRENAGTGRTETSNTALTNADNSATALTSSADTDQYIPQLDAVDFNTVLNNHTGIYYYRAADEDIVEDSSAIPAEDWNRIPNNIDRINDDMDDVELGNKDLLRVYLSYTIPAGSLNATNPVARYRLPSNLHLTDPQVKAINENVNGLAGQYADMSTLEITDPDKYNAYLGVEAVEGTRRPDEAVGDYLAEQARKAGKDADDVTEYISAVVRVENVYDADGLYGEKDAYLGQDLIFTFAPYSIEKNQHEYDSTGKPTKAGEEIKGWFTFDLNMGQVDFEEPEITTSTAEEASNIEDNVDGDSESSHSEDENTEEKHIENVQTEDDHNGDDLIKEDSIEDGHKDESNEENHSINNTTVDVNTADNESSEDGKADDNQDHAVTIERAERTAEIIFVEEEWDGKDKKTDQISTTLTAVEETVLEGQNDGKLEDDEDPSVSGEKERLEEENEGALSDEATADGNVKDPVDTEQVIMPAMSFNDSIKVSTGKPVGIDENAGSFLANAAESLPEEAEVSVRVEADEGTFPAGTTMVLSAVDQSSYDTLAETLAETVERRETSDTDISDTDTSGAKANTQQAETDNAEDQEIKQNTEQNNADNNTNIKTYGFQAVDITFFDKDGNEIEPAKPVRVALTSKVVEQAREKAEESAIADPVVVHVDNEGKAEQMDLVSPEEVEPAKGRSEEEMLEEAEKTAESGKTDNADDDISADDASGKKDVEHKADSVDESASAVSMDTDEAEESSTEGITAQEDRTVEEDGENRGKSEFTADSFSVYAIVYTVELYTNIITDSGETYRISVTYDETSGIPQDAELKVKEIKEGDKGYEDYYTEAVKAASESSDAQNDASDKDNKRVNPDKTYARFFDIEIWANGEKVEPAGDVSVSIRLLDVPETDDKSVIKIVHFAQDDIEVIPHTEAADYAESLDTTKDQDDKQAENSTSGEMEFNFTASSFSVYSVVSYTVDFHWVVDGEEYTFSIKGGSAIAFSDLLPIIGVVKDDPETEVNEVGKFIENVQSVSFSNPKLLSVSKVESDTTVEAIKNRLGLECEYSADLTEEQIEEINNTKVQSGDWILISLKSFQSEETITVTMDKGDTFTIKVTDPPGTITTVDTKQMGLTMNLFDYGPDDLDHVNNALGTGPQDLAEENYTDTGINQYSDLKFFSRGTTGTGINNFTGSMPYEMAAQGIVQTGLIGGYPALYNNQSLDYLFNMDGKEGKTVYANVNHLFKWDNGKLKYNSDENYAFYTGGNAGGGDFKVYNGTFHEEGADNANFFIGFFPFNDYNSDYQCIHGKEFNWNKKPGCNAHQGHYNHHFGLSMEGTFQIRNNEDMTFHFSGDDDMWVFVDDVLVLDIGGIHNPIDGNIDFKNKTVSVTKGSNTAADARRAVDGQTIAPDTISAAFARQGKTWDGTNGSYHEIKVFYLERGGMYSNLEMEINLPFVQSGKLPFNKKNDSNEALAGAKFSIYTDPACQHPLSFKSENASAISDENGVVSFSGLPVGTYYMKETTVPDGYQLDPSVYTVILKDKNGGEASIIRNPNPSGQNVTTIVNNEITIDLSVQKNWQDADKTPITPENSYSSTFQVRRLRSYELPGVDVFGDDITLVIRHVENKGYWTPFNKEEYKYKRGQQITVNYNYNNQYASNNARTYRYYDGYTTTPIPSNNIPFQSYNNNAGNTGSINVTIPENGVYLLEFYDVIDSSHPNGVVTWTISDGATQGETHTDEPDTGYTGPTLTLSNGNTTGIFNSGLYSGTVNEGKFPVQKIIDGVKYTYKYYIVETTPQDGFEPVYVDGSNNEIPKENLEANASSIATGTGGTQTIINRKLMNIPVVKYWPDYSGDEYTWTAKLKLDYRNVPVTDPDHPTQWYDFTPTQTVEISKSDTQQKYFTGLPMYYIDNDGNQYRREYSVVETEYIVTKDGHIIAQKGPNSNPPSNHRYTPWYIHDAGEVPDSGTVGLADYDNITVQNMLENLDIEKELNLDVTKTWSDDIYVNDSAAKAVFQLKRYVITEYRNYESLGDNITWVDITLDTGTDHNQKLHVPQGITMYIRGYLKDGVEEGDIKFSSGLSPSTNHVVYDSSNQGAFSIEFTADSTKTITLDSGSDNGTNLVIGGKDGFRLSESNSIQSPTIDESFCIEFELSNEQGWSKHFPEPASETQNHQDHDDEPTYLNKLPIIEVSILDDQGLTANTYVYRYFLEEVSCQPDSFNATFTTGESGSEELLGDEEHQIYFDSDITATNRPTGLDILKVDMDHPENVLSGAQFTMRKLDEDSETGLPYKVSSGGEYVEAATISSNLDATDSDGKLIFTPDSGLTPGYYEVKETMSPTGYVLLEDPKFYIKVEKLGVIKLAGKNQDGTVNWPGDDDEGVQAIGNVSIASSTTAEDGKTITVTVRNEPGAALPSAGGFGTDPFYFLGTVILVIAGMMYYIRWCRAKQSQNAA